MQHAQTLFKQLKLYLLEYGGFLCRNVG